MRLSSPSSRSTVPRNSGFTMLEVVLAIVIAVGLLLVVLHFYRQAADLRASLLRDAERVAAARLILDRLTTELRTARPHSFYAQALLGDATFIQFIKTDVPSRSAWAEGLYGRTGGVETDLKLVTYELAGGSAPDATNSSGILITEEPLLETRTVARSSVTVDVTPAERPQALPVSDELRYLRFRYWSGTAWAESWSGSQLPVAVEVTLAAETLPEADPFAPELETEEYVEEIFRRVIYLPGSQLVDDTMPLDLFEVGDEPAPGSAEGTGPAAEPPTP